MTDQNHTSSRFEEVTALLHALVDAMVDDPAMVKIESVTGESLVAFEVTAPRSELGKLIGREGRNLDAIREIIRAAAAKHGARAVIHVRN